MFLVVVTDEVVEPVVVSETGKTAGFDFGLKDFLTCSEGFKVKSPLFFRQGLRDVLKASRDLSRKRKGSNGWHKARINLARRNEDIRNRRRDWFWQLAHKLTDDFDVLFFETLNLKGMQGVWGRKVSDLAPPYSLQILEWVAVKKGKVVKYMDQWFPSSKMSSHCGHVLESLELNTREWQCPSCGTVHDRDDNAAVNIKWAVTPAPVLDGVRRAQPATVA